MIEPSSLFTQGSRRFKDNKLPHKKLNRLRHWTEKSKMTRNFLRPGICLNSDHIQYSSMQAGG